MNTRSIKVCKSNHATVLREYVPTLTFMSRHSTLLTVTFWLALHGHHAHQNLPSHSQELIFKPMEAFQERLGMGKARWCFVFRLGFFVWWIKNSKTNTRDDFFKLHLYIYIFTGHYWAIFIYIYIWQNAKRTHPKNSGDLLIQTEPETLSAFSDLEIPTVWGTTGGFTKKAQVSCGAFWWPAYWTAK